MKKAMLAMLALLFIAPMGMAQYHALSNNFLFGSTPDTIGGPNSYWKVGLDSSQVGRRISNTITSQVPIGTDPVLGTLYAPATRAWIECVLVDTNKGSGGDVDSIQVFIQGISMACTTETFLDTLVFNWAPVGAPKKNTAQIREVTPQLYHTIAGTNTTMGTTRLLPYQWRFFVSPADSGDNFAQPYVGGFADTIIVKFRVILEANGNAGAVPGL